MRGSFAGERFQPGWGRSIRSMNGFIVPRGRARRKRCGGPRYNGVTMARGPRTGGIRLPDVATCRFATDSPARVELDGLERQLPAGGARRLLRKFIPDHSN